MNRDPRSAPKTLNARQQIGKLGEATARRELQRRGYEILESNFRTRQGEVDIVARHRKQYVFVEVKARRGRWFGMPEEAVDARKREHLIRAAQQYLRQIGKPDADWRIDVLAVEYDARGPQRVELIESAVEAGSESG